MDKFKWCFIGTGTLATHIAKEITDSGRHEIVSCYTRDPDKCRAFATDYGAKACTNAKDAILAEGVEGVYIVTPHNAHYRYAKEALELGKPILCEKAFTVKGSETDDLIKISRDKGVYLCEAMWTWFGSPANQVRQWVDSGRIGRVTDAHFTYCMQSINYAPRVSDPRRAGGALLDITIYPITYAYRLWGYPVRISSNGHIENGVDHYEEVKMEFAGDEKVSIRASIVDFDGLEKMTINGDKGQITADNYHFGQEASCILNTGETDIYKGDGESIGYMPEFDTVASEIREGLKESAKVPLKATSDVMHILDTIRQQIGLEYTDLE
ncbi:Gfo/Idh/MocA family protein [Butyrivibrio sp. MC2013]|uniref:Gfo/Idh/MocA family protein n=1 Tax=Butyrivibrio sp. MC2013 TaxID=1280686 RepID=UPI0004156ECF|nr:Gfo/Idh/MocA family oxidoreductase [Butyrivibrio sp. MC2013]